MDPDPTSDQTPFFSDFKDAKIIFFQNSPAGTLFSVLKFNFFAKILYYYFLRKGKDLDPEPDPYLCLSGRPKNMRIMRIPISIPNTTWN
jgi:hypothetical protein